MGADSDLQASTSSNTWLPEARQHWPGMIVRSQRVHYMDSAEVDVKEELRGCLEDGEMAILGEDDFKAKLEAITHLAFHLPLAHHCLTLVPPMGLAIQGYAQHSESSTSRFEDMMQTGSSIVVAYSTIIQLFSTTPISTLSSQRKTPPQTSTSQISSPIAPQPTVSTSVMGQALQMTRRSGRQPPPQSLVAWATSSLKWPTSDSGLKTAFGRIRRPTEHENRVL